MDQTVAFWLNWGVQLLVALGTIGAVLAALFGKWFAGKVFPPKLRVWLENEDGERVDAMLQEQDGPRPTINRMATRWY